MDENDTINMTYSCRVRLVMMCKERGTLSAGMPKGTPSIVTVPKMNFVAVRGRMV